MANYDTETLTISSLNFPQHDILHLTVPESDPTMNLNHMDAFDPTLNFDGGDLLDNVNNNLSHVPFTPYDLSDAFSTNFEDPFAYHSSPFESLLVDNVQTEELSSKEPKADIKLLSFGSPILKAPILDGNGQSWPAMSGELNGMFFIAEDVFNDNTTGRPIELTCYRRNLFSISATITLSRSITHMVNEQGQHVPIYNLSAVLTAFESIEGKDTEIITVKPKNPPGASGKDKAAVIIVPTPKWPLDLTMNPEMDLNLVSIPLTWARLQFKHATANNGRRKGLQQHYVVQINLVATLATGENVKIAEIQSGPVIVRGRSPRNFDGRRDVPITDKKSESKHRTSSDAGHQVKHDPSTTNPNSYRSYALDQLQQPVDLQDWTQNNSHIVPPSNQSPLRAKKSKIKSPNPLPRPPIPMTHWKSERSSSSSQDAMPVSLPIDLSLADDEYGRSGSASGKGTGSGSSADSPEILEKKKTTIGSPVENLELLYEYFPLSLDDWMPPVDAIYRPHVVHHTIIPPDLKALQVKNKTKRYFTGED